MSEEDIFNAILFTAALIATIIMVTKGLTRDRRVRKVWRDFAAMKGLDAGTAKNSGDILYSGKNRGFPFVLERVTQRGKQLGNVHFLGEKIPMRAGDTFHTYTRMRLSMSGLPAGLSISRETIGRKIATAVGAQDIRTGDPEVDGSFVIKGKDPAEVGRFLNSERCNALKVYLRGREEIGLRNNELLYERKNSIENISELSRVYMRMGEFAAAFAPAPPPED